MPELEECILFRAIDRPGRHKTTVAQQTGMHMVVGALLVSVYQRGKGVYMYIRPTLLPEATLPPRTCPAEPVRTNE
jgi:hypothetical protein